MPYEYAQIVFHFGFVLDTVHEIRRDFKWQENEDLPQERALLDCQPIVR